MDILEMLSKGAIWSIKMMVMSATKHRCIGTLSSGNTADCHQSARKELLSHSLHCGDETWAWCGKVLV